MCDLDALDEQKSPGEFVHVADGSPAAERPVIVVGGGLAGLTVANTVLQHGGSVVVLEKSGALGGNSAKTVSGISAVGTSFQSAQNIHDTVDLFVEDVVRDGAKRPDLITTLCARSGEAVQWLVDNFELDLSLLQRLGGHSMPRVHQEKTGLFGHTITKSLAKVLECVAESSDGRARVCRRAWVRRLLTSAGGACLGCAYTTLGSIEEVLEVGPVVICSGGFAADFARGSLLAKLRPDLLHLPTSSMEHCVGDGIRIAKAIGGRTIDLEWVQVHPLGLVKPDNKDAKIKQIAAEDLLAAGALLLNAEGDRFSAELGCIDDITIEMWRNCAPFWLLLNSGVAAEHVQHCQKYMNRGLMKFYKNGEMVAKEMGIAIGKLEATHEAHYRNAKAKREQNCDAADPPLYPKAIPGSAVRTEAFHAAIVTPVIHHCMGGLEVNTDGCVLSQDGPEVEGLYAAGEVVGGAHGTHYLIGNSQLECIVLGRIAGTVALKHAQNSFKCDPIDSCSAKARPALTGACPHVLPNGHAQTCIFTSLETRGDGELGALPKPRGVVDKLERMLESRLTEATLQAALAEAQLHGGDLNVAAEELCRRICGSTLGSDGRPVLEFTLRDPPRSQGIPRLPTKTARTVMPATGASCAEVPLSCVYCRLPLTLEVSRGNSIMNTESCAVQPYSEGLNAYATLLYGSGLEYFLGALVIGHSLKKTGSTVDRLLLHTDDVPGPYLKVLEHFWTLRRVQYLEGTKKLYKKWNQSRFKAVFTKLQALSCQEYNKVLMLDLDMLIRSNIDSLFDLRTPAAMKRSSGRGQPAHGGSFDARDLWRTDGEDMCSGINAGVMLLQPDARIYKRMLSEIRDPNHPEHIGTFGPEQDYLSRFYCVFLSGTWTHIHARYNYQLQLPDDYVSKDHRALNLLRDVAVAHYSGGRVKPWELSRESLGPDGLKRLLHDDTVRASFARVFAPPGAGRGPPRERIMDGVQVVEDATPQALPEDCQEVMWEWVLALRECSTELSKEHGVDVSGIAEEVATNVQAW